MVHLFDAEHLPEERPKVVIAVGTFDGVHRGHKHILSELNELAEREGARPMVVMFDFPPAIFFNPELPRELVTLPDERIELLGAEGVELILHLKFDEAVAKLTAHEFLDKVNRSFDILGLLVGYDHRIGSDVVVRDEDFLRITNEVGIGFSRVGQKKYGRWTAASSLLRRMIREARLRAASALLGRFHTIRGAVVPGENLGAELACPTANMLLPEYKLSPPAGVYAGIARVNDGGETIERNAAINIMPARVKSAYESEPPDRMLIEAHLLGFDGDLYGRNIEMSCVRRIRQEIRFESLADLKRQIALDVEKVRDLNPLEVQIPAESEAEDVLDEDAVE